MSDTGSDIPSDIWRVVRSYLPLPEAYRFRQVKREFTRFYPFELQSIYRNESPEKLIRLNQLAGLEYRLKYDVSAEEFMAAIMASLEFNNLVALQLLTKSGAPLNNEQYLLVALAYNSEEIIEYLLDQRATLPPIHYLIPMILTRAINVTHLVLQKLGLHAQQIAHFVMCADLMNYDVKPPIKILAIKRAVELRYFALVHELLRCGVDVKIAILTALRNSDLPMLKYLFDIGADQDLLLQLAQDDENVAAIDYIRSLLHP